jgi:hypothetical protein
MHCLDQEAARWLIFLFSDRHWPRIASLPPSILADPDAKVMTGR